MSAVSSTSMKRPPSKAQQPEVAAEAPVETKPRLDRFEKAPGALRADLKAMVAPNPVDPLAVVPAHMLQRRRV